MELKDFIYIRDNVIPLETLSSLIKWTNKKSNEFKKAAVIQGTQHVVDNKIRKVENLTLNPNSKSKTEIHWHNFLFHTFKNLCAEYQNKFQVQCSLMSLSEVTILKYENHGHYEFHTDHHATAARTLTVIYLLNNDYEGGNLVFGDHTAKNEILTIDKLPNRAIIWPSNFLYPHKVIPVTKGIRYYIVSWAQ